MSCAIIISAPVTFLKGVHIIVEDNVQPIGTQSDDLAADIICFAEMFERLSPEAKSAMLEILRQLNGVE